MSLPLSLQPVDQTNTESRCIPATSPDPVTARATRGRIDTPVRMTLLSSPESSASPPTPKSRASNSPPGAATVEHTTDSRTPFGDLGIPSSPSSFPAPVLHNMLSTGTPLSSDSPVTRPDHATSSPESHVPVLAPVAPFASTPPSTSAPHPDISEDGGKWKAGLRKVTTPP